MSFNWLFLDLNSFFASVEQAENPELQNRPVAVVPMIVDSTCCLAASYEAKYKGVKTGTSLREAKQLCPEIKFVVADHKKYVSYHKKILKAVDRCIPISFILSIDEMACELMGREKKNCIQLAHKIKQSIYDNVSPVMHCSIGVAPNRYLAKVASDMQKPNGLTLIKKKQIPKVFYPLKIEDFTGIGPRMKERLNKYGCYTTEQLYELSSKQMRIIWSGVSGEEFWQKIRGENLKEKITSKKTIGHSRVIAPQYRKDKAFIKALSMQLLTKACIRLRNYKMYAKKLSFNVKFSNNHGQNNFQAQYWKATAKFEETQNTLFITSELEKILNQLSNLLSNQRPTSSILKIGLSLSNLREENKHQLSIFEDFKAKELMNAVDSINDKHGSHLVYPASSKLYDDKAPARIAFSRIPEENE